MVFGFHSKKRSDGSVYHYMDKPVIRDITGDSPVIGGFVTQQMLEEQEKEMEDFIKKKADDFENQESETTFADMTEEQKDVWKDIEDEIKGIEKDKNMTLEDKTALLYQFYDENKDTMPYELKSRILADLESLDKLMREKKREEGLKQREERLHQKINMLKSRLDLQRQKTKKIPVKSTDDMAPSEKKEAEEKSDERADDWEKNLMILLAKAGVS